MPSSLLSPRDILWALPSALLLGAALSALSGGPWVMGFLVFALVLLIGLLALAAAWRWAGGGRALGWALALALLLRLIGGAALDAFLPVYGYDTEQQRAGYVFFDAYRRDSQAWDLARSGHPIWEAFNKKFHTDQYGGLLALSALAYRYLSPDAHRPLLIVLLAALTAALGAAFFWKAARTAWGEGVARPALWVFALYPEGVLQGSSQMREPFLMAFIAMSYWGFVEWQSQGGRRGWGWLGAGFLGMLLVSPAIALFTLLVLGGYWWFEREHGRRAGRVLLIGVVLFVAALFLLSWGLNRSGAFAARTPIGVVAAWFREAVKWDVYQLERGSGWVQKLFREMDERWRLWFVLGYGLAQPVLPAAFVEPTTVVWRVVGVLRALGWYLLAPFLAYGLLAAWRTPERRTRRLWLWLGMMVWVWIALVALRAGGDQWDNPRYRVIMLTWQALVAGYAWAWWRTRRDPWLTRLLLVEAVFLGFFTQWYANRYYHLGGQLPFWVMVGLIAGIGGAILFGGWLWDRRTARRKRRT